jgi:hypothetical protein
MVGQVVGVVGSTQGVLAESGAVLNVPDGVELTLVAAPRYDTIDSLAPDGLEALRVMVRVGSESDAASFIASVPWSSVRLRAEILLLCYLDDITLCAEAHLIRPFFLALRELGPSIGLFFDSLDKNFTYIPRVFRWQGSCYVSWRCSGW